MESCISSRLSVTINASSHASWSNISTTQSLTSLCWECWFIPTISPNPKALTSCGTKIHLPKPRPKTQALQHVMGILSPSPPIKGSFSFTTPLRHIFGFADDYNKIVYGFKHELSLVRDSDDNAILLLPSTTWRKSTWVRSLGLFLTSFLPSDKKNCGCKRPSKARVRSIVVSEYDSVILQVLPKPYSSTGVCLPRAVGRNRDTSS